MNTIIYIVAAGMLGMIAGIIIEMVAEKPYIEGLERKLELKNSLEIIEIEVDDKTLSGTAEIVDSEPEDLFTPF